MTLFRLPPISPGLAFTQVEAEEVEEEGALSFSLLLDFVFSFFAFVESSTTEGVEEEAIGRGGGNSLTGATRLRPERRARAAAAAAAALASAEDGAEEEEEEEEDEGNISWDEGGVGGMADTGKRGKCLQRY